MGILKGEGASDSYRCKVEYLRRTEEVAIDDVVVTSGMDERFPKDLEVGRVTDVTRKQYGLYQQITVTPSVDYARLREAFVIVDREERGPASDQADEGTKGKGAP